MIDLPALHESVVFGRSGGRIIWQPRIGCWHHDKLFAGKPLPERYMDMGLPDIYRGLGCSARLYYIEALAPPPTCDVPVAQAHQWWPDKALWINFPSSVHLESADRIRAVTRQILAEARSVRRFLLGITEDVPADRWPVSFRIILDEVNACPVGASSG